MWGSMRSSLLKHMLSASTSVRWTNGAASCSLALRDTFSLSARTACAPEMVSAHHAGALWAAASGFWALAPALVPEMMSSLLLTGKSKHAGKNKRWPKKANHGARPCSHVGRRQRAAAKGRYTYQPKR